MISDDQKTKLRFDLANADLQSIGRTQGIYVTALLAYLCFFWGVSLVGGTEVSLHMGPFDLRVIGIWGITPFVLLFLTLVYTGSLTAAVPARARLRDAEKDMFGPDEHTFSALDTHKNLIDYLAVLQLNPKDETRTPVDGDEPKTMRRLPNLILPVLFLWSAFTCGRAVVYELVTGHYVVCILGLCCFGLQLAYSVRPVYRWVARFLGAKRTDAVYN